ncbi:MAG TPA: site-2 protease family protein [Abditibacteriaceae bacterium]
MPSPQQTNDSATPAPWSDAGAPLAASSSTVEATSTTNAQHAPAAAGNSSGLSFDLSTNTPSVGALAASEYSTPEHSSSRANSSGTNAGGANANGTNSSSATERKGFIGLLFAAGAFLLKFKFVFAFLKFGKILTTMSSMLLSIGAYALVWGWKFATGFVLLTFVHEMGHVLAAWRKKLPVSAPMFIPFMGAFIALKENPQDALTEAEIGYGGPLFGALGDSVVWAVGLWMHEPLLLAVASFSMMVNLFNMMPVGMLDGGRIVAAIDPRLWLLGLIGMTAWFFKTHSPIMLLVIILGAMRLFSNWKTMRTDDYFKVPLRSRIVMSVLYIGLAMYLAWGQAATHRTVADWMVSSGRGHLPGVQIN